MNNQLITICILSGLLLLSGCDDASDSKDSALEHKQYEQLQMKINNKLAGKKNFVDDIVEIFKIDKRLVLLETSGLIKKRISVVEMMEKYVEPKLVDFNSGKFIDDAALLATYDEKSAIDDPQQSDPLNEVEDPAGIGRRERIGKLYLIKDDHHNLDKIVVPIRSKSRLALLYGYLALDVRTLTITGIGFYQHAETPGLGGEFVHNPKVKQRFMDKKIFKDNQPNFSVIIKHATLIDNYSIDGVTGATYTSRAVENAINYWCGKDTFGSVIQQLHNEAKQATINSTSVTE